MAPTSTSNGTIKVPKSQFEQNRYKLSAFDVLTNPLRTDHPFGKYSLAAIVAAKLNLSEINSFRTMGAQRNRFVRSVYVQVRKTTWPFCFPCKLLLLIRLDQVQVDQRDHRLLLWVETHSQLLAMEESARFQVSRHSQRCRLLMMFNWLMLLQLIKFPSSILKLIHINSSCLLINRHSLPFLASWLLAHFQILSP